MNTVTSADGTVIAFDRLGNGPPVIIVGGLLCDRAKTRPIAEELAEHATVINYDRRGRGDSSDTAPYAVDREVEDLAALIAEAGGSAAVYGHSSGAGLALQAAAQGLPIARLILHEPPYARDLPEELQRAREFAAGLQTILADRRHDDAIALVMTDIMEMPPEMVEPMRAEPWWPAMAAMAPTIAYDSAVMGDSRGGGVPVELLRAVTAPTLVLAGGESAAGMIEIGRQMAEGLPNGRFMLLEGQEHVVPPDVLAPVLAEFMET